MEKVQLQEMIEKEEAKEGTKMNEADHQVDINRKDVRVADQILNAEEEKEEDIMTFIRITDHILVMSSSAMEGNGEGQVTKRWSKKIAPQGLTVYQEIHNDTGHPQHHQIIPNQDLNLKM